MNVTLASAPLDSDAAWSRLTETLGGEGLPAIHSTIRHLRALEVRGYVVENPYIDRDYSADYAFYYAQTFHPHERHCKRIHFFARDISPLLQRPLSHARLDELTETGKTLYCGFCVVRPLPHAPIGKSALLARVDTSSDMDATVTCRADIEAHLLGTRLQVSGTSFLQQDSRVGACAQAAVWAGMRHMHERHGYHWISVPDITRLAGPPSPAEAAALPNASGGLSPQAMVRAIAEAGHQPLVISRADIRRGGILPYVESGIPVVLVLNLEGLGLHAVTVIGRVFAKQQNPTNRASGYVPAFLVHDDQSGPYMWVPVDRSASADFALADKTIVCSTDQGDVELNLAEHSEFAVALMPRKVFATAQYAEQNASHRIHNVLTYLLNHRQEIASLVSPATQDLLDELQAAHAAGGIVLRTYLTSAAGYRRHLARSSANDALQDALLHCHLPHFSWITEIATIESYNGRPSNTRIVYGHAVEDATATVFEEAALAMHVPGVLLARDPNVEGGVQRIAIENDGLYESRQKSL